MENVEQKPATTALEGFRRVRLVLSRQEQLTNTDLEEDVHRGLKAVLRVDA